MVARPSKRTSLIVSAAAVVVLAGGGTAIALSSSGSSKKAGLPAPSASTPAPAPSTSSVDSTPPPVAAPVNPLTGIGPVPSGPVFAVKIDDTENGRPQRGVDLADVVYIEQAEGGLTRTVQVYASKKPVVEAVRSVRASDAELLSQYGKISLVASGGGGDSLTTLRSSIVNGVINDSGGPGFSRDDNRPAPYNLESDLAALSSQVKTASVQNIGFHFRAVGVDPRVSAAPAAPTISATVGSTAITFVWSAAHGIYIRSLGGQVLTAADGGLVGGANVIVQYCQVSVNPADVDVEGNPSQYTHSVGSGRATLYRNGHRIEGKWSRPSITGPTTFTDLTGTALYQAPGSTYVLLATA